MSFANTVLQQRERESKALRIFLACSLAGSLIFHLALLASGITKYLLNREPSIEDEPVEITLLDTPIEEIQPEPKEEIKPEQKPEPKPEPKPEIKQPVIDTSKIQPNLDTTPSESRISGGSPALSNSQTIPTQPRIAPPPVVQQPLPIPKIEQPNFKPIQPLEKPLSPVLPSTPPVVTKPKPIIPEQKPESKPEPVVKNDIPKSIPQPEPEPEVRTPREFSTRVTPPIEPPAAEPDEDLEKLLAQTRDNRRTARSLPNPAPVEPPASTPQDSGELRDTLSGIRENRDNTPSLPDTSDIGGSSDNAPRRKRRIIGGGNVASAPTDTTGNGLGNGSGDSVGDGDGNAACRRCQKRYPSWARSRGIQGSITVSVDADAQGNITEVRLVSGSGNDRLDKHHVRIARRWKLKRSSNGRQGVTIITRYQLE